MDENTNITLVMNKIFLLKGCFYYKSVTKLIRESMTCEDSNLLYMLDSSSDIVTFYLSVFIQLNMVLDNVGLPGQEEKE